MPRRQITHSTVFLALIAGFLLQVLLLATAALISVHSVRSIKHSVDELVGQELVATRLLDDIQREQAALSAVFLKLYHDPDVVQREKVLSELDESDRRMDQIGQSVAGTPEEPLWRALKKASVAFSAEARRLLWLESPTTLLSRDLFHRHEESLSVASRLAAASNANATETRSEIERRSAELLLHSGLLLGACVLLALLSAIFTVRMVGGLIRRMEGQAGELSRVSWHMLENQEVTARRFSHELHDELGQSLTAVKANLHGLAARGVSDSRSLEDCVSLVNDAIGNVRELSQLLHPTILDDFGLDAALRWHCERFTQRTGIEVEYRSSFAGRLPPETETHLFRICQEALTNVARHSGATRVRVGLAERGGNLHLSIADNGCGLPAAGPEEGGLGLTGMRARARSAGGTLAVVSAARKGVAIEVEVPAREQPAEEEDADSACRRSRHGTPGFSQNSGVAAGHSDRR